MYCWKLTDEEIKQGELIFGQLERGDESPWTLDDLKFLVLLPWNVLKWDWEEMDFVERLMLLWIYFPLLYIAFCFLNLIIC